MQRGLRLLLMALVCAALGGVYVLLGSTVAPAEAPAPEFTDAPGYFMLYEDSVAALKSITVQPKGSQRYTAVSDMAFDRMAICLAYTTRCPSRFWYRDRRTSRSAPLRGRCCF